MDYGQILDTRDLIARIAEIEEELALPGDDTALREELEALREVEESGITDWQYGETLIREDYFTEYAQQLAEDIGAVDPNASWPLSCIDWEAAAGVLQVDYTTVELDGSTYFVRA